ncbi:MAG: CPBP family intramembrane glutamate endopeptidase, partial [Planctomycetaceae bacterium]
MRWSIISVIFRREVRDQIRDRRTLFMIFVLPILLYPILGIGIVQLSTAFEQKPRTVLVVGPEHLPMRPRLLNAGRDGFDPDLFDKPDEANRLRVKLEAAAGAWLDPERRKVAVHDGTADAVMLVPPEIR